MTPEPPRAGPTQPLSSNAETKPAQTPAVAPPSPKRAKLILPEPNLWFEQRTKRQRARKPKRQVWKLIVPSVLLSALMQYLWWLNYHQMPTLPPPKLVLPEPFEFEYTLPIDPPPLPEPEKPKPSESADSAPAAMASAATSASAAAAASAESAASAAAPASAATQQQQSQPTNQTTPAPSVVTPSVAPEPIAQQQTPSIAANVTPSVQVAAPSVTDTAPMRAETEEQSDEKGMPDAANESPRADVQPMRAIAEIDRSKIDVELSVETMPRATYETGVIPQPADRITVPTERPMRVQPDTRIESVQIAPAPITMPAVAEPLTTTIEKTPIARTQVQLDRPQIQPQQINSDALPAAAEKLAMEKPRMERSNAPIVAIDRPQIQPNVDVSRDLSKPAERIDNQPSATAVNRLANEQIRLDPSLNKPSPQAIAAPVATTETSPNATANAAPASNAASTPNAATAATNSTASSVPANPFGNPAGNPASSNPNGSDGLNLDRSISDAAAAVAGNGNNPGVYSRQRGFKKFNNPFAEEFPSRLQRLYAREPQLFLDLTKFIVKTFGRAALGAALNANEEINDFTAVDAGPLIEQWIQAHHSDLKRECVKDSDMPEHVRELLCNSGN